MLEHICLMKDQRAIKLSVAFTCSLMYVPKYDFSGTAVEEWCCD